MKEEILEIAQRLEKGEITELQARKLLLRLFGVSGQLLLPSERFDAEDWLCEHKDIWNHPIVADRNDKESYEVVDLMSEFANWYYGNFRQHRIYECLK